MSDIDLFNENGFIIKKDILKFDLIDNIINKINQVIMNYCNYYNISYNNSSHNKLELLYDMLKNLYNINKDLYFNFVRQNGVLSDIYEIKSLFTNENIIKLLNDLGYNNISIPVTPQMNFYCDFATHNEYRNGKIGIDSHQDWPQTRGSLNHILLWIPLIDINEDNCPILAVPKSHLNGFIDGNQNSHNIVIDNFKEEEYNKILLKKGDSLLFNSWLVHKTGCFKNNGKIRIAIALRINDLNDNYFISTQYKTAFKVIADRNKEQTRIPYNDEIIKYYKKCSIEHFADLYNKRKFWYNNIGKNIENIFERLIKLQRFIKCDDMSKEIFEQSYVLRYINENSKVLELGGNIGRVSLTIATILNDDKNLVVIEPAKEIALINKKNRDINCFKYNIETNILSLKQLFFKRNKNESMANKVVDTNEEDTELINNISYNDLQEKYNIIFDTLVIDCEGSFYNILKEQPYILDNINTIIIENDFETLEEYNYVYNSFINKGFKLINTDSCYPIWANGVNQKHLYQTFKK